MIANDPASFRRSFRFSNVRSPEDLIKAVDGFLLANFGKPSSWWHSRRAEVALNSSHSGESEKICELVDCYEFARYSEVGGSLPETKVQRCAGILADLVRRAPAHAKVETPASTAPVDSSPREGE